MSAAMVLALGSLATGAFAQNDCAAGKTLTEGVLTVATGNPAYPPWVMDNDPASGKGFEAAMAYAVAGAMGFEPDQVVWVSASFDQSIQPGVKDFDINLQQFSITEDREKVVDFSAPYYSAAMAVVASGAAVAAGATPDLASLKGLKWGAHASTTAYPALQTLVAPEQSILLYDDTTDVNEAMKAGQVDAAMYDLPTALYLAAVEFDDAVILGQFPADRTENPDQFGFLMAEGNPLKACVDDAIAAVMADGSAAAIEAEWLQDATGVPVIE